MKSRFDSLQFSLAVFLFVVLGSAVLPYIGNMSFDPRAEYASIAGARAKMKNATISATKSQTQILLDFLADLDAEIAALPAPKVVVVGSVSVELLSVDPTAPHKLYFYDDSLVYAPASEEMRRTVTVSIMPPDATATFIAVEHLAQPFGFAGGSFPGTGGTCGNELKNGCTIVLTTNLTQGVDDAVTKAPLAGDVNKTKFLIPELAVRYRIGDGAEQVGMPIRVAAAYDVTPPKLSVSVNAVSVQGQYTFPKPASTLPITVPFTVEFSGQPSISFSSIEVTGDAFSAQSNTCKGKIERAGCKVVVVYRPTVGNDAVGALTFTYTSGLEGVKKLAITLKAVAAPQYDASKQILIVYNTASSESVGLKDYYLAHRPGFQNANTLGITFPSVGCSGVCPAPDAESIDFVSEAEKEPYYYRDASRKLLGTLPVPASVGTEWEQRNLKVFRKSVVAPITSWLAAHPEKDIRYVVLVRGVPSRIFASGAWSYASDLPSVTTQLRDDVMSQTGIRPVVMRLDMGSRQATEGYIQKLATMYTRMQHPSPVVSARDAGQGGDTVYAEDVTTSDGLKGVAQARAIKDALQDSRADATVVYRDNNESIISSGSNPLGFFTWGVHSGSRAQHYARNGETKWSGNASWWIMQSGESFNGQSVPRDDQGNFTDWFSADAWGGSNYDKTPVGAVTHAEEPGTSGLNSPELFTCFASGEIFADCANRSANVHSLTIVGDPWVRR